VDKVAEVAGFGLILGFLYFVWPPLVLLGGGLLLVAWANTRTRSGRLGGAAGAAWSAARRAYTSTAREIEDGSDRVRRIA
jgi:hypothetical protein